MSYLLCNHCHHKNNLNTGRHIFCDHCHKKMAFNYLDWQQAKVDASFETYLIAVEHYNEQQRLAILKKVESDREHSFTKPYYFFKAHASKKSIIFFSTVVIQLVVFMLMLNQQQSTLIKYENTAEKTYLKEVKWQNHSITADLSLVLPFELKKSNSMLPEYLQYGVDIKSKKSESQKSFSVTIEDISFENTASSNHYDLLDVKDEYMKNSNTFFTSREPIQHLKINNYTASLEEGTYTMDGKEYVYENYTLVKDSKAIKIIISYLQNDHLLSQYAGIVTQSLHKHIG